MKTKSIILARLINIKTSLVGDSFVLRFGWPYSEGFVKLIYKKMLTEFEVFPELDLTQSGKIIRGKINTRRYT